MTISTLEIEIIGGLLATDPVLPPIRSAGYEYVVAANGLFIRAEDRRMEAMAPVMMAPLGRPLPGLAVVSPYARLKVPRISRYWLQGVLQHATQRGAEEVMYQFFYDANKCSWDCWTPAQSADAASVDYSDMAGAVVDLHSHHAMPAFFSETDDRDETGLRFYAVIGRLGSDKPEIRCRAGVYGYHWPVPATAIFDFANGAGPFIDLEACYE